MIKHFLLSSAFLFFTAMAVNAGELYFNQQKCLNEENPEGIFLWEQFYFCKHGNSPKGAELVYFLSDKCPVDFVHQTDFDLAMNAEKMVACSSLKTNWLTDYANHPKRVGFYLRTCPSGKMEFAGTERVKFCK